MALSATNIWEVRTTGDDTNGGAFQDGASGTDWSQQDAAQYSVTDGVTAGTSTITSASANFGTDVVGNVVYVSGGTGSVVANRYQIISRASATSITVDRSTGLTTGTGVTLKIGGALASPGMAAAHVISSNQIWVKSGTYTITSASTNISNGCVSISVTTSFLLEGYQTTRGDLGTPPTIVANGVITSFTLVSLLSTSNNNAVIRNFVLDGNSRSGSHALDLRGNAFFVKVQKCAAGGFSENNWANFFGCVATECTGGSSAAPFYGGNLYYCVAYANTKTAFVVFSRCAIGCISINNTGASTDGFARDSTSAFGSAFVNCIAYGNGRDGFSYAGNAGGAVTLINCISEANTTYGYSDAGTGIGNLVLLNCADYGNGSGRSRATSSSPNTFPRDTNGVTGSGSFFINAASGDFTLNNTSGRGAALRAAGFPASYSFGTALTGTSFPDIGPYQHEDAGGGGSSSMTRHPGMNGGLNA